MKKVLSLLMAFVFLQVQARALSGGPVFGTDDSGAAIGLFAGVLLPEGGSDTSGLNDNSSSNSLGVFALSSPSTGLATGSFTYFDSGRTYEGVINGLIDPQDLRFRALVRANFNVLAQFLNTDNNTDGTTTTGVTQVEVTTGTATGSIDGRLRPGAGGTFSNNSLAVRIEGDADLDVQNFDPDTGQSTGDVNSLKLKVDGFKQSNDTAGVLDATVLNTSS